MKLLSPLNLTEKKRSLGSAVSFIYHSLPLPLQTAYKNDLGPSASYFLEWTQASGLPGFFFKFEDPPLHLGGRLSPPPVTEAGKTSLAPWQTRHQHVI